MNEEPDFNSLVGLDVPGIVCGAVGRRDSNGPFGSPAMPSQMPDVNPRCWAQSDNAYYGVNASVSSLPPAMYKGGQLSNGQLALFSIPVETDTLVKLPDTPGDSVVEEIRRFRTMRDRLTSHGFLFKRNLLLWGPPGSGKTSTINQLCDLLIRQEGAVAFYVDHPVMTSDCLQLIRRIEPDRPILAILEDLDALVDRYGEQEYLALLDGSAQVDNIVCVATTNYPERLDRRFVDRPGRFATIRYIGMPSAAARETYLAAKVPSLLNGRMHEYVDATDGFSIDYLKELVYLTQCEDVPVQQAVAQLRRMMGNKPDSEKGPSWKAPGFDVEQRQP